MKTRSKLVEFRLIAANTGNNTVNI